MNTKPRKRVAKTKITISERPLDALKPSDRPWIAWDDKLTGSSAGCTPPASSP